LINYIGTLSFCKNILQRAVEVIEIHVEFIIGLLGGYKTLLKI